MGAASRILKSKIEKTAAAFVVGVVGVGLLVGSTAGVQAACDPPVFDVCFHKSGSFHSSGYAELLVEFNGKSGQLYEYEWNGLKKLYNPASRRFELTYDSVSQEGRSGYYASLSYGSFWWEPSNIWNNYGCSIYEGHWDYSGGSGEIEWVRGDWVAHVDFYAYQEAAYVSIDNRSSALDFELGTYYCTIDWDPEISANFILHGYSMGYWEWVGEECPMWPVYGGGWYYNGDPGSPRFHYEESCSSWNLC